MVFHAVPFENASTTVEIGELFFCSESGKAKVTKSAKLLSEVRFTEDTKIIRRDPAEVTWPRGDARAFCEQTADGTEFHVPTSGSVMRWNCIVPAPVALAPGQILEMRYRAENLDDNPEAVLFLGWNVVNDAVPENMRPVTFNSFVSDGLWRIARAQVPAGVDSAWTFAVMVRAGERGNGKLTIDYLKFYDSVPENRLEQSMKITPLTAMPQGFAAIQLPTGNRPVDALRRYFS